MPGRSQGPALGLTSTEKDRDYWRRRQGFFNSADFALASRTLEGLAAGTDVIVPGHDN